ncbi:MULTISPECIES: hypothetical protein [unclassified Aureispira]|uniref:hypothetical protein n=1 Tax=unclassified Aureispira TaxID=2649989 RepID=UPI000695DF5A|nr:MULTISPECIES: hypothetical protein [unclassified Aureispira]WMX17232.1 hypothetical protein QP953_12690 [Aureispira sp. CCB-E]
MTKKPENSMDQVVLEKISKTLKWWNHAAAIHAEDSILVIALKLSIRVIGIAVLVALSPFAIFGFILAVAFAM